MNLITFLNLRSIVRTLFFFSLVPLSVPLYGQDTQRGINVIYISEDINIDGVMDEAVWENADPADNFWQFFTSVVPISGTTKLHHLEEDLEALNVEFTVEELHEFREAIELAGVRSFDSVLEGQL